MFDKEILDDEGYPTQEYLDWLSEWEASIDNKDRIKEIIESLGDSWRYGDWGFIVHRPYSGKIKIELHTGGWSGNEDIIRALQNNFHFWSFHWRKHTTGGHYYFEFKTKELR